MGDVAQSPMIQEDMGAKIREPKKAPESCHGLPHSLSVILFCKMITQPRLSLLGFLNPLLTQFRTMDTVILTPLTYTVNSLALFSLTVKCA